MLAFAVGALGVAILVLLVARSYWMQERIRAGLQKLQKLPLVAMIEKSVADSTLRTRKVTGSTRGHASPTRVAEQRKAVVLGLRGSSAAFHNHTGGTVTVKDVMNRSLAIHYFEMLKGPGDLAGAK
jgi:hypothetical protein